MKRILTFAFIFQFLLVFQYSGFSKPYQPQVKGGYKSFTATDYRYEPGTTKVKSVEKTYTVNLDSYGNQAELIYYENNQISSKTKLSNKYDSKVLLVETVYYDASEKAFTKFTYEYDERMNKIRDITYNQKGDQTAQAVYKYDKNNFLIQVTYYVTLDNKENITNTVNYKNDEKGNPIEETTVQTSGSSMSVKYIYKYDEKDNITRSERYSFDNFKFVKEYKYDNLGNIIEESYFDDNGKLAMKSVIEYSK